MSFYIKYYIILASVLTIISTLIFNLLLEQYVSFPIYITPTFYALISVLWMKILEKPKFKQLTKFSNAFMLTNMVKLFVYLIFFVVFYFAVPQEKKIAFAVYYMSTYAIFASVDTIVLLKIFKNE
ncbi:MAG: hypothetical protein IJ150_07090 [Bacteroidales bacterium]|nr:hypothetical protein [Bacteroidales bacterium]